MIAVVVGIFIGIYQLNLRFESESKVGAFQSQPAEYDRSVLKTEKPKYPYCKSLEKRVGPTESAILHQVASEYELTSEERKILFAIRIVENGKAGLEMGVGDGIPNHRARREADNPAESLHIQAQWAAGTIVKRYRGKGLNNLARRYCPPNWDNWEHMIKKIAKI